MTPKYDPFWGDHPKYNPPGGWWEGHDPRWILPDMHHLAWLKVNKADNEIVALEKVRVHPMQVVDFSAERRRNPDFDYLIVQRSDWEDCEKRADIAAAILAGEVHASVKTINDYGEYVSQWQ